MRRVRIIKMLVILLSGISIGCQSTTDQSTTDPSARIIEKSYQRGCDHSKVLALPCSAPEDRSTKAWGSNKFWKNKHNFKVRFLGGTKPLQDIVMSYAADWSRVCNVKFERIAEGAADVRIAFAADGHWSYVGTDAKSIPQSDPTMNLEISELTTNDEIRRVVLHEFGHALGLMHEHQHPETPIIWNEKEVLRYYSKPPNKWDIDDVRQNVLNKYSGDYEGTAPDPCSIMQYPIEKKWTRNRIEIGWNSKISKMDAEFMISKYGKPL